jgi:hypothetical protein
MLSFSRQFALWQTGAVLRKKGDAMQSVLEPQPHYRVIHHKLKDSLSPIYLTLLSVIQGVALADLALVVAANYQQFTLMHWLLVLFNFGVLIGIWNHYMMNNKLWDWIPDLRDACIPFVVGILELFLNHTIFLSLRAWLFTFALLYLMGALAMWHVRWRAGKEAENARLLSLLKRQHRLFVLSALGASALFLLLAMVSRVESLEVSNGVHEVHGLLVLGIALLAAVSLGGFVLLTIGYWRTVVTYARTGHLPGAGNRMHAIPEPQGHHLLVKQRLTDSFSLVYLTLLSVIQGVALADLALIVGAGYQQFTVVRWLLVLVSLWMVISVWHTFTIHITLWSWIPDLRDAIVPFVIGALELVFNHTISVSLSAWFFILAIIASMATLAIWYVGQRAKEENENARMLSLLRRQLRLFALYNLGAGALYFLLAIASRMESLEASNGVQTGRGVLALALVLLVAGGVAGVSIINTRSWNQVVSYSRTDQTPGT